MHEQIECALMQRQRNYKAGLYMPTAVLAGCLLLVSRAAIGQELQISPEADVYINLPRSTRLSFQAGKTIEEGNPHQKVFGANFELFMKPLLKLDTGGERPDKARLRILTLCVGYRYLTSPVTAPENRVLLEANPRLPLPWKLVLTDRNRGDLRMIGGKFSWRYRNRLTIERVAFIRSYSFTPYVKGEGYYDSNYSKWSAAALVVGASFPIQKHAEIEPYYQHFNQTGCTPIQQVETFGLKFNLYF